MSTADSSQPSAATSNSLIKPLRTWILWFLLPIMAIARFIPEWVQDGPSNIWMVSAFGPFLVGFGILLWWLFASRARWTERLLGFFGLIGILFAVLFLSDSTMVGPVTTVMTIPLMMLGFALASIVFGRSLTTKRTWALLTFAFLFAATTWLAKTDGVWGNFAFGLQWRWETTSEEKLLADLKKVDSTATIEAIPASELTSSEWPIFRGPKQDGAQHGCTFSTTGQAIRRKNFGELRSVPPGVHSWLQDTTCSRKNSVVRTKPSFATMPIR